MPHVRLLQAPSAANKAFSLALEDFLGAMSDEDHAAFIDMMHLDRDGDPQHRVATADTLLSAADRFDREHRQKSRARAFGARYLRIVGGLQSYFSAIDSVVSSNPTIAACVWGALRFVFEVRSVVSFYTLDVSMLLTSVFESKVANKYFRFFESLTSSLERVAEDLDFYNDYAITLYNKWDRVQTVRTAFSGQISVH